MKWWIKLYLITLALLSLTVLFAPCILLHNGYNLDSQGAFLFTFFGTLGLAGVYLFMEYWRADELDKSLKETNELKDYIRHNP